MFSANELVHLQASRRLETVRPNFAINLVTRFARLLVGPVKDHISLRVWAVHQLEVRWDGK
jgi:hypothetical protein